VRRRRGAVAAAVGGARSRRCSQAGRPAGGDRRARAARSGTTRDLHRFTARRGRARGSDGGPSARGDRARAASRKPHAEAEDTRVKSRIVFLIVAVLAGIEVFHYLDSLNVVMPPVTSIPVVPPPSAPRKNAPARRVVWVLVDGLR